MLQAALVIGFGAFVLTESLKSVVPWPFQSWGKVLVALSTSAVVSLLLWGLYDGEHTGDEMAVLLAGWGISMIIHRTHRYLGAAGDLARINIMRAAGRQPR